LGKGGAQTFSCDGNKLILWDFIYMLRRVFIAVLQVVDLVSDFMICGVILLDIEIKKSGEDYFEDL